MRSKITAKFQITIPKNVRTHLKLKVADAIEWKVENRKVFIEPVRKSFLKHKSSIKIGRGEIRNDIDLARTHLAERYK